MKNNHHGALHAAAWIILFVVDEVDDVTIMLTSIGNNEAATAFLSYLSLRHEPPIRSVDTRLGQTLFRYSSNQREAVSLWRSRAIIMSLANRTNGADGVDFKPICLAGRRVVVVLAIGICGPGLS
jgi:hypothetical protein